MTDIETRMPLVERQRRLDELRKLPRVTHGDIARAAITDEYPDTHHGEVRGAPVVHELTPLTPRPRSMSATVQAEDLARITSEAMTAQFETAAKSVEAMADGVNERIATLNEVLADIKETAASIREKGKLVTLQVKEAGELAVGIRDSCNAFREKVGA